MSDTDQPILTPPVQHYQCWDCGGTGLDSIGDVCPHCEGLGFC
ncbi:hypothetical protein [Actinoallomurus sp. CA-142502]